MTFFPRFLCEEPVPKFVEILLPLFQHTHSSKDEPRQTDLGECRGCCWRGAEGVAVFFWNSDGNVGAVEGVRSSVLITGQA